MTNQQDFIDQIFTALDGRTQRWLSIQVKIFESDLSMKLRGKTPFTQSEIDRITKRLNISAPAQKAA